MVALAIPGSGDYREKELKRKDVLNGNSGGIYVEGDSSIHTQWQSHIRCFEQS